MPEKFTETLTARDLMTPNPATLDRNETLDLPDAIMNLGRIRHMPVVEDGKVVGVLSQRDLFRSALIAALGFGRKTTGTLIKTIQVKEVMSQDVITIAPNASVKEAARVMIEKNRLLARSGKRKDRWLNYRNRYFTLCDGIVSPTPRTY
jgi:CBS domain-containing protein